MTNESEKWASVTFIVRSDKWTVTELSDRIGMMPDHATEKGTHLIPDSPRSAVLAFSMWELRSLLPSSRPLAAHLEAMLQRLEQVGSALEGISAEGARLELFVGFAAENGQGGDVLDHLLLRRIASLPITIRLDLYPPERFA